MSTELSVVTLHNSLVSRHSRSDDQRIVGHCARLGEGEGDRASRAEVLGVDRRLHPGLPVHLPADVDLQAGV